jgi:hypothetical protein
MLLFGSHYRIALAWIPLSTLSSGILSKQGHLHGTLFICHILGMLYGFDAAPERYCSISFNSAEPVTRYRQAEILVSALSEFGRDKARNSAVQRRRPQKFTMLRLRSPNGFGTGKNCPLQPLHFGNFEGRVTRYCRIE